MLLVEDDDAHAMIAEKGFRRAKLHGTIDRVYDGVEAVAYVRQEGRFRNQPRPNVILLDLNLPQMDGHEVLRILKADDELRMIPVVVLTTSDAEQDRRKAYGLHANGYLVKPINFGNFRQMISAFTLYWGVWNRPAAESHD